MAITILHLTDLHAGSHELRDEDQKQRIPEVERCKLLSRLGFYLENLSAVPDYVVITGDFTIAGDREGLEQAKSWLAEKIKAGLLPPSKRIMVTPGNHDVRWGVEEGANWHRKRYEDFWELFAKAYPHAYIPSCDPGLDSQKPQIDSTALNVIGGLDVRINDGAVEVAESHPFLLDLQNDLLIFAFNSSLACGVFRKAEPAILEPLEALEKVVDQDHLFQGKIKEISEAYRKSLLIDSGYIGEDQLTYFARLMTRMKLSLGARYERLTKIAILHHHVSHLWRQQLEVKNFESVIDAAQLKQRLAEYEFDLVLHGHKHTNHVALDASIVPISSKKPIRPICVVSGGTVGGYPRLNDRQTFKLLTFNEPRGPRTAATILEVPLEDSGDPRATMKLNSTVYNVPIFSKIPEVHDLKDIKGRFDDFLKSKLAPELLRPGSFIVTGGGVLPPANSDIVGESAGYHFDCVVETKDTKIFYDIMLADSKIDFRQRTRIYMFLTNVKHLAASEGTSCKIVLLIGNLEATHFFRGEKRGEVKGSIEKLKGWFAPALASGLLEIRFHVFTQGEIEAIATQ